MQFKKFVAPIAISAALLGGSAAVTAGVAGAAAPTTSTTAPAPSASHSSTATKHPKAAANRRHLLRFAIRVTAKTIGITPKDLRTELKTGKSVVQVAAEHNVSSQTLVTDLVNAGDARVDKALAADKLTVAQATKIKAALPARVTKAVDHVFK